MPNIYKINLKTKTHEILEIFKRIFTQYALPHTLEAYYAADQVLPFFYPHFFLYAI